MKLTTDLRLAAKRAYKGTALYKLRALLAAESKWKRRETIARNKLAENREQIATLAETLAKEAAGVKEDNEP